MISSTIEGGRVSDPGKGPVESSDQLSTGPKAYVALESIFIDTSPAAPTTTSEMGRPIPEATMAGKLRQFSLIPGWEGEITLTRRKGQLEWDVPEELKPTNTGTRPVTSEPSSDEPTSWGSIEAIRETDSKKALTRQVDDSPLTTLLGELKGDVKIRLRLQSLPPDSPEFRRALLDLEDTILKKGNYPTDPTRTAQAEQARTAHGLLTRGAEEGEPYGAIRVTVAVGRWNEDAMSAARTFAATILPTVEQPFGFRPGVVGNNSDDVFAQSRGFLAIPEEVNAVARPSVTREVGDIRLIPRPEFAQNGPRVPADVPKVSLGTIVARDIESNTPREQLTYNPFEISQQAHESGHKGIVGAPARGKSLLASKHLVDVHNMYENEVPGTVLTSIRIDMSDKKPESKLLADMRAAAAPGRESVHLLDPMSANGLAYGLGGLFSPLKGETKEEHGLRFVEYMTLAAVRNGGVYEGDARGIFETAMYKAVFGHGRGRDHIPGLIDLPRDFTPDDLLPALANAIEKDPALQEGFQRLQRTEHGRELINFAERVSTVLSTGPWKHFFTSKRVIDWQEIARLGVMIDTDFSMLPSELKKLASIVVIGNVKVAQDQLNNENGNSIIYRSHVFVDESDRLFAGPIGVKIIDALATGRSRGSAAARGGTNFLLAALRPDSLGEAKGLIQTWVSFAIPDDGRQTVQTLLNSNVPQTDYGQSMEVGEAQAIAPQMHNGPVRLLTEPVTRIPQGKGTVDNPREFVDWGIDGKVVSVAAEKEATRLLRDLPELSGWVHTAVWAQLVGQPTVGVRRKLADTLARYSDEVRDVAVNNGLRKIIDDIAGSLENAGIDAKTFLRYMAPKLRKLAAGESVAEELPPLDLILPQHRFTPLEIALKDGAEPSAYKRVAIAGNTAREQISTIDRETDTGFRAKFGAQQDALRNFITAQGYNAPRYEKEGCQEIPGNTALLQFEYLNQLQVDVTQDPSLLGDDWDELADARGKIVAFRENALTTASADLQTAEYEKHWGISLPGNRTQQLERVAELKETAKAVSRDPLKEPVDSGHVLLPLVPGGNALEQVAYGALSNMTPGGMWRQKPDPVARSAQAMVDAGRSQEWVRSGLNDFIFQLRMHPDTFREIQDVLKQEINSYQEHVMANSPTQPRLGEERRS